MADLIKKIDEFYVGFKAQGGNSLPLAFLTPFDGTAAFKKRKETVDSWATTYGVVNGKYQKEAGIPAINVKNEPLDGFKVAESVKRTGGWNSGNVVWRIEDPRGFEWEIPSPNLAQIITQTGISAGGVINGRCIIGRLGSTNILIPEGTDLWDQMVSDVNTRKERDTAKVLKDLRPGDHITLKNGETGIYLGKRKVNIKTPIDKDLYERLHKYNYQNHFYQRSRNGTGTGDGFEAVPSVHEYHLISVGLSFVRASKGNPPVISVDPNKGISMDKVESRLTSTKLHVMFAGKAAEEYQEIMSVVL